MNQQENVEQSSPLTRKEIKTGLNKLLVGLLSGVDEKAKQSELYAALVNLGDKIFKDPDTFFFIMTYDQENQTKAALKTVKCLNNESDEEYCHVFLTYSFYESHIERLCTAFDGSFACADKSRTIVGRYLNYLRTGEKGKWEAGEKGCYWLPLFGSQDDWFEYMKGLHYFYYGQPDRYLKSYQKLFKLGTESRDRLIAKQKALDTEQQQEQSINNNV